MLVSVLVASAGVRVRVGVRVGVRQTVRLIRCRYGQMTDDKRRHHR